MDRKNLQAEGCNDRLNHGEFNAPIELNGRGMEVADLLPDAVTRLLRSKDPLPELIALGDGAGADANGQQLGACSDHTAGANLVHG